MQKVLGGYHKTGTKILHAVFESREHSMQVGITLVRRSRKNVYIAQELEDALNRYLQP